jgi:hypothetical protein
VEHIDEALSRNSRGTPSSSVAESNQGKSNNGDKPTRDTTSNSTNVEADPAAASR